MFNILHQTPSERMLEAMLDRRDEIDARWDVLEMLRESSYLEFGENINKLLEVNNSMVFILRDTFFATAEVERMFRLIKRFFILI